MLLLDAEPLDDALQRRTRMTASLAVASERARRAWPAAAVPLGVEHAA